MAVAAYASLVSLIHTIDHIHRHHPIRHRIHSSVGILFETLQEKICFLHGFLEVLPPTKLKGIQDLAREIADVCNEAEEIFDVHVVDLLRGGESGGMALQRSFCHGVQQVIEKVASIQKVLASVDKEEEKSGTNEHHRLTVPVPPANGKGDTMVGLEEPLIEIMTILIGDQPNLQVIPIVGMGGIGKTTLAVNAFDNQCIVEHFNVRIWCVISQKYSVRDILLGLLDDRGSNGDVDELGGRLYKRLCGKRYLIVMDDMWSVEAWYDLKMFLPNNRNRSRIMVTTRLSNVADSLSSHSPYSMNFLDDDKSWNLFCQSAFAPEVCPPELEEIGHRIATSCRGLPLAIVTIGGLLANSIRTRQHWELVAKDVISFGNSGNDEHCLKVLALSYDHLPMHLKACFLFLSVFPEDYKARTSSLIKLWVAEGCLKPSTSKSLEEVAEECVNELINRNLILIHERGRTGKVRLCGIHDLLRDLCLKESDYEHLFQVPKVQRLKRFLEKSGGYCCFLCNFYAKVKVPLPEVHLGSESTSLLPRPVCETCRSTYPQLTRLRLVKTEVMINDLTAKFLLPTRLRELDVSFDEEFFMPPTPRCRYSPRGYDSQFISLSMLPLLWNLQTLKIESPDDNRIAIPSEIWEMPQLRYIIFPTGVALPDPVVNLQNKGTNFTILEKLHTLSLIKEFSCSEMVLKRIPNLKKLKICSLISNYFRAVNVDSSSSHPLRNLVHLRKLESLHLDGIYFAMGNIVLPESLKEVSMRRNHVPWEVMRLLGSLPNLEALTLYGNAFNGRVWSPVEGQFQRLKYLLISESNLVQWRAEKFHFPVLLSLELRYMNSLEEIPPGIGEIDTLRSICLYECNQSVIDSAKQIVEDQQSYGNDTLQLTY